jgi:hypothetical protein
MHKFHGILINLPSLKNVRKLLPKKRIIHNPLNRLTRRPQHDPQIIAILRLTYYPHLQVLNSHPQPAKCVRNQTQDPEPFRA